MDENAIINEIINKVSEMYRSKIQVANQLSREYDSITEELSNIEISHKKYIQLQDTQKIISAECNNQYHVAEGISDVREMLFELLKG